MSSASLLPCEMQSWHYRHFIFKMVLVEEINPSVTETIKMCQCDDKRFYYIVLKTLL